MWLTRTYVRNRETGITFFNLGGNRFCYAPGFRIDYMRRNVKTHPFVQKKKKKYSFDLKA